MLYRFAMWQPPERIKHPLPETKWPSKEEAESSLLFKPLSMGRLRLSSRTWIPAMVPWRASPEGMVTDDVIDWYARFAKGAPGAIVVEATGIRDVPSGPLLRAGHERFIPGLKRLVDAIANASDGKTSVFIQLIDFMQMRRRPEQKKFFARFFTLEDRHREALASATSETTWLRCDASLVVDHLATLKRDALQSILNAKEIEELFYGYRERIWDTHLPHIAALPEVLPELFADAAEHVMAAGFDGIELHYAHAYTMASFLSALNTRTDGYGGNREERARLPLEVIAAVRKRIGTDAVLGLRFLGDEVIDGGNRIADATYFALEFAKAEVDFISVSKGGKFEDAKMPKVGKAAYPYTGPSGYECMPSIYSDARGPFARNVGLAATIKQTINDAGFSQPVVTAGGICTFEQAESILQEGRADIIASARQCIADPDWFLKVATGCGSQIRRCEYTNYCEALDQNHKQVTCKLWDRTELGQDDVVLDTSGKRRLTAPRWQKD